jgi:hypothetical protein
MQEKKIRRFRLEDLPQLAPLSIPPDFPTQLYSSQTLILSRKYWASPKKFTFQQDQTRLDGSLKLLAVVTDVCLKGDFVQYLNLI